MTTPPPGRCHDRPDLIAVQGIRIGAWAMNEHARQLGDSPHRELVEGSLLELAAFGDEHLARLATLALEQPFDDRELEMLEAMGQSE